ncbi:MAG: hypothetical protein SGJ18_07710 [Pseudomonadota bacterium]|nr:hypothetical protein [Pseudomonadota bacterium]
MKKSRIPKSDEFNFFEIFGGDPESSPFSVFWQLGPKKNPKKTVRIYQESRKLEFLKDPLTREMHEYTAGVMGVPFDRYLRGLIDFWIEYLLSLNDVPRAQKQLIIKESKAAPEHIFRYGENLGKYKIFRFSNRQFLPSQISTNFILDKRGKEIEVELRLPKNLGKAINQHFSKNKNGPSIQVFLRRLFERFLIANGLEYIQIDFDKKSHEHLENQIQRICEIKAWKPCKFKSPPILNTAKEFDHEFLACSYLIEQSVDRLIAFNRCVEIKKVITLRSGYDPFRVALHYISYVFWSTPSSFLSLLVLQEYRAFDRDGFIFISERLGAKSISAFIEKVIESKQ